MAEEQENLNDFKRWDTVGATAFLAFAPAVMCFVLTDHEIAPCLTLGGIGGCATIAVLVLTYVFPEIFVGRVVNLVGMVLAPVYLAAAVILFYEKWTSDDAPAAPAVPAQQSGQDAPGGQAGQGPTSAQ